MSDEYDVGYGKPPRETQFKPGQSGNAKGRRKGVKNLSTLINAAAYEQVVINVGGRRRKVSKLEAAFIQQCNKAAAGDIKAAKLIVELLENTELRKTADAAGKETAEDRRARHDMILQALQAQSQADGGDDGGQD